MIQTSSRKGRVTRHELTPDLIDLVAERFKVLSEPARLRILNCLRTREMTVTDLVSRTGLGQANVSRHLQVLHNFHFVSRRKDGLFMNYSIADQAIFTLCDIVCGKIEIENDDTRKILRRGS